LLKHDSELVSTEGEIDTIAVFFYNFY
jgi:hypothetical protein